MRLGRHLQGDRLIDDLQRVADWLVKAKKHRPGDRWLDYQASEPWFEAALERRLLPQSVELRRDGWTRVLVEMLKRGWLEAVKYRVGGESHTGYAITRQGLQTLEGARQAVKEGDLTPFGLTERQFVGRRSQQLMRRDGEWMNDKPYKDQARREYAKWEVRARRSPQVWKRHEQGILKNRGRLPKRGARPIRLDRREIKRVADAAFKGFKDLVKPMRDSESFARFRGRPYYESRRPVAKVHLDNVKGEPVEAKVYLGFDRFRQGVLTAGVTPEGDLYLFANSLAPKKDLLKHLPKVLIETVAHEMTHLADILPPKETSSESTVITQEDAARAYFNEPAEVRGWMRTVFEETRDQVHRDLKGGVSLGKAIERALKKSSGWLNAEPYLTPKNRKLILKGLVTAFQDEVSVKVAGTRMYHGTSVEAAREIERWGFSLAKVGERQRALYGQDELDPRGVFLTTDLLQARWYAGPDPRSPGLHKGGAVVVVEVKGRLMSEKEWWALRREIDESMGLEGMYDPRRREAVRRAEAEARKRGFKGFRENRDEYVVFDPADVKVVEVLDADSMEPLRRERRAKRETREWLGGKLRQSPPPRGSRFWHMTSNPRFRIKPEHHPWIMRGVPAKSKQPMLFVTDNPRFWESYLTDTDLYAALIDVRGLEWGEEWGPYIEPFEYVIVGDGLKKAKVKEVLPLGEAIHKYPAEFGWWGDWALSETEEAEGWVSRPRKGLERFRREWLEEHPGWDDPQEWYGASEDVRKLRLLDSAVKALSEREVKYDEEYDEVVLGDVTTVDGDPQRWWVSKDGNYHMREEGALSLDLASDILDYFKTGWGKNPLKNASARRVVSQFLKREAKITLHRERFGPRRLVAADYRSLKPNDRLTMYHGTRLSQVFHLINGFDATKVHYRQYGGSPFRGLFVTPDFETARRFASSYGGQMVLEMLVRAKNLHGTDYSGVTGRRDPQQVELWRESYPESFRPYLSFSLSTGPEPQALLEGLVAPRQIKRVWYAPKLHGPGKWFSRKEFLDLGLKAVPAQEGAHGVERPIQDLGVDLSYPNYNYDEFIRAVGILGRSPERPKSPERVEEMLSYYAREGPDTLAEVIEEVGFEPRAAQVYADRFGGILAKKENVAAARASGSRVADRFVARTAKITFRDERCPRREYSRRFSLCDSEAGPIPKGENLFRDEMRTWSKRNFKKLKKPVLETPGVSDPCDVAFIDYSGGGQGTISLHLVITRSDRRGQGLATKLLREFYRQQVPQGANVR